MRLKPAAPTADVLGVRASRATAGSFGVGLTLVVAAALALLIVSAVVSFRGWPGGLSDSRDGIVRLSSTVSAPTSGYGVASAARSRRVASRPLVLGRKSRRQGASERGGASALALTQTLGHGTASTAAGLAATGFGSSSTATTLATARSKRSAAVVRAAAGAAAGHAGAVANVVGGAVQPASPSAGGSVGQAGGVVGGAAGQSGQAAAGAADKLLP